MLFGLAPALRTLRLDLHNALKIGGRNSPSGGRLTLSRQGLRGLLVVAEVALSLTLLVGAGLLIRSFTALSSVPPGFQPARVLSLQMTLSGMELRKPEQVSQFVATLEDRLRQVPGVVRAGVTSVLPFTPSISWGAVTVEDYAPPPGQADLQLGQRIVTPDYFAAMGVPLKEGRFFTTGDAGDGMPVVLIDEKMARRFWPNESPIGRRVKSGRADSKSPWRTVVGVVGDVKQYGLDVDGRMVMYFAHQQVAASNVYVVIRSAANPEALTQPVISAIRSIDPRVVIYDAATMDQRLFRSLAAPVRDGHAERVRRIRPAAGKVGIYGVMSHLVSQRTRDIGILIALGAEKRAILGMVFKQGGGLATAGIVAGLLGASFLTRLMTTLLFGVSPTDVVTLASVAALLGRVAAAASYPPARRATRVDPLVALRDE